MVTERSLNRTVRVLGVAIVADGRAVDFALVETDGGAHVRLAELERRPLSSGSSLEAVIHATRAFLGDRVLQPFAIDRLALYAETSEITVVALAAGTEVETTLAPPGPSRRSRAEQAAFAVVAALVAAG